MRVTLEGTWHGQQATTTQHDITGRDATEIAAALIEACDARLCKHCHDLTVRNKVTELTAPGWLAYAVEYLGENDDPVALFKAEVVVDRVDH